MALRELNRHGVCSINCRYELSALGVGGSGDAVTSRDKEQRKSRIQEMLRLLQLDSLRDKLVRDLSHPQQIMLQWEILVGLSDC